MPRIDRIVVVLPEPFGPRNPINAPGGTARSSPSTATLDPVPLDEIADLQPSLAVRTIHTSEDRRTPDRLAAEFRRGSPDRPLRHDYRSGRE